MTVRFFNTYEPVVPLYRDLVPLITERRAKVEIVVSRGRYRRGRELEDVLGGNPLVTLSRTVSFGRHAYQGLFSKIAITVGYLVHASARALFGRAADLNVFLTQPPFFPLLGRALKALRGQPYYVILMDLQPDLSVAIGLLHPRRLATRVLSWSSTASLRGADGIIVIGRCMAEEMGRLGIASERIHLIPNWADERQISPIDHQVNQLRRDQGWEDKFVVAYAGNIGLPQHFDDALSVAEELRGRPEIVFTFIGEGLRKEWLAQEVNRRRLENVALFPFLHERLPLSHILSAGDVHLVSLKESCTGKAVPSKAYAAMAAGRPLIFQGDPSCEIARIIVEEGIGAVVPCGAPDLLKEILLEYANHPGKAADEGRRSRRLIEGKLSRQRSLQLYLDLVVGGLQRARPKGRGGS